MSDSFGRYKIMEELGRGGMATVFLAKDPRFDRQVAVKVLPRAFLHDPQFQARFEREAKTVASLEHPAIVPVHDFGEQDGQPFLVMRYMPGGTLADRMRAEKITPAAAHQILKQVGDALDAAHAQGIVHRDLKPDNILFDHVGNAYLSDFGIVKIAEGASTLTGKMILGTPAYMSPEQARGDATVDQRSDLYSLGIILFEMLSGVRPFEADTPMGYAMKHVNDPVPHIREINPELPEPIDAIMEKALAKDPEDRYQNAHTLTAAFESWAITPASPMSREDMAAATILETGPEPELDSAEADAETILETRLPEEEPEDLDVTSYEPRVDAEALPDQTTYEPRVDQEALPDKTTYEPRVDADALPDKTTYETPGLDEKQPIGETVVGSQLSETLVEPPDDSVKLPETLVEPPDDSVKIPDKPKPKLDLQESLPVPKRRKIPVWAIVAGGLVVLGGAGVILANSLGWLGAPAEPTQAISAASPQEGAAEEGEPPEPEPIPREMPPVVGPDPSDRVAVFYYPWYANPDTNGHWSHWEGNEFRPPEQITSDYFPALGPYSSFNPFDLAQHMAWLREAGVGLIISSWWGPGSFEDEALPLLLEIAGEYGIKVAFHIEPYHDRSADRLVEDIQYLYDRYGAFPAFYRTPRGSLWIPDDRPKGLFFLWAPFFGGGRDAEAGREIPGPEYWLEAMDRIHELPDGGIVIANASERSMIVNGHFDGLYNYATLNLEEAQGFDWAKQLPLESWYVPSVLPGFSANRLDQDAGREGTSPLVPRHEGGTYNMQWEHALSLPFIPDMVTITSFNEWHEGTQIEPAAEDMTAGDGYVYQDYRPLPPEGYLGMTREWVERYLNMEPRELPRIRIHITSTSDWTSLRIISGAERLRFTRIHMSEDMEVGFDPERNALGFNQPLELAEAGRTMEFIQEALFDIQDMDGVVEFAIERGHLGMTVVEFYRITPEGEILIGSFRWGGIVDAPDNPLPFEIPASEFFGGL